MNVNDIVEVTLSSHGRLVLYKYEIGIGTPVHSKGHMTGDVLRIQLWELMNIFGPEMRMANEVCFEGNELRVETAR